ncbi:MAG: class I SAM-dependent methyltransferase [Acidobacteriota bacterium]
MSMEGWRGWDDYARFYDWENAQTMGRRDVKFWQQMARQSGGPVVELGCGTGRISLPMARTGVGVAGIDRSATMLARARKRSRLAKLGSQLSLIRGDICFLPFRPASAALVAAPYGILQSLLDDTVLDAALAEAFRIVRPGGTFAVDMVSDLVSWQEYDRRVKLRGTMRGSQARITLIESVRQDRTRGVTMFDQEFVERRGSKRHVHAFSIAFRTVSVQVMTSRLERAGFAVSAVLGDYEGGRWDARADVWLIVARKPASTRKLREKTQGIG